MTEVLTTEEELDLSDLDLLDEEHMHVICTVCNPGKGEGDVVVTVCGKKVLFLQQPKTCDECDNLFRRQHCPIHGDA